MRRVEGSEQKLECGCNLPHEHYCSKPTSCLVGQFLDWLVMVSFGSHPRTAVHSSRFASDAISTSIHSGTKMCHTLHVLQEMRRMVSDRWRAGVCKRASHIILAGQLFGQERVPEQRDSSELSTSIFQEHRIIIAISEIEPLLISRRIKHISKL